MVQIVGKYQHVSNSPDFEEYLKALGAPEDLIRLLADSKPTVTVSQSGDNWELDVCNAGKNSVTTFKLGEPYDEPMPHGLVFKSVTTRDGNKFNIKSTVPDGRSGSRVYDFSDAGFTVFLKDDKSGKQATRVYKRI